MASCVDPVIVGPGTNLDVPLLVRTNNWAMWFRHDQSRLSLPPAKRQSLPGLDGVHLNPADVCLVKLLATPTSSHWRSLRKPQHSYERPIERRRASGFGPLLPPPIARADTHRRSMPDAYHPRSRRKRNPFQRSVSDREINIRVRLRPARCRQAHWPCGTTNCPSVPTVENPNSNIRYGRGNPGSMFRALLSRR